MRILKCRFPFPDQDPPVNMPEACSSKCPNADETLLAMHDTIPRDDPELQEALRQFARWFYDASVTDKELEEQIRHAAELYTRAGITGTCIPKTILFMHYKHIQYSNYTEPMKVSDAARQACRGETVASWPDGALACGISWNAMFRELTMSYDA